MKELLGVFLAGLIAVLAYPAADIENDLADEWVMIPDIDWNMHLVNTNDVEFRAALEDRKPTVVDFILFTRDNPIDGQVIPNGDVEALRKSHFNANNPTRIICHGWRGSRNSQENGWFRDKYLTRGEYNIIVIDWSSAAGTINYIAASSSTMEAGKQVAGFIDFLSEHAHMKFDELYMIGFSLGAHVCGIAGKFVTRGRINTIFGLDAAYPLFSIAKPSKRLAVGDALYVESIHTNGGLLGFHHPIGDASFYPNWGKVQKGCSDFFGSCSHTRSTEYFAESLTYDEDFIAEQCQDFKDILNKNCNSAGVIARMGGEPSNYDRNIKGQYYMPTNSINPFAIGSQWIK